MSIRRLLKNNVDPQTDYVNPQTLKNNVDPQTLIDALQDPYLYIIDASIRRPSKNNADPQTGYVNPQTTKTMSIRRPWLMHFRNHICTLLMHRSADRQNNLDPQTVENVDPQTVDPQCPRADPQTE